MPRTWKRFMRASRSLPSGKAWCQGMGVAGFLRKVAMSPAFLSLETLRISSPAGWYLA